VHPLPAKECSETESRAARWGCCAWSAKSLSSGNLGEQWRGVSELPRCVPLDRSWSCAIWEARRGVVKIELGWQATGTEHARRANFACFRRMIRCESRGEFGGQ